MQHVATVARVTIQGPWDGAMADLHAIHTPRRWWWWREINNIVDKNLLIDEQIQRQPQEQMQHKTDRTSNETQSASFIKKKPQLNLRPLSMIIMNHSGDTVVFLANTNSALMEMVDDHNIILVPRNESIKTAASTRFNRNPPDLPEDLAVARRQMV